MSLISNSFNNPSEKLIQGSLISESFSNKHEKHFQDSNHKFSSAQHSKEKASSRLSSPYVQHSSSSISACSCSYSCPNSDMECACITTSSYSKHEIFSASSVDRKNVVAQTRDSTFRQPSLPSESVCITQLILKSSN